MKIKFKDGETIEEMFGYSGSRKEKAEEMYNFVLDLIKSETEFLDGVKKIYERGKNAKEVGYMLLYYVSLLHAINFDMFLEDLMKTAIRDDGSGKYDMMFG